MKFSTKVRYGLKALVDLSLNEDDTPIMASSLAQAQSISLKYLERILNSLKKAELIKSIRGCHGGYVLNKKPEEISIYDIYIAVEGELFVSPCQTEECSKDSKCYAADVWNGLNDKIVGMLKDYTLASVVERAKNE